MRAAAWLLSVSVLGGLFVSACSGEPPAYKRYGTQTEYCVEHLDAGGTWGGCYGASAPEDFPGYYVPPERLRNLNGELP